MKIWRTKSYGNIFQFPIIKGFKADQWSETIIVVICFEVSFDDISHCK